MSNDPRATTRILRLHPLRCALGLALVLAAPMTTASLPSVHAGARLAENILPRGAVHSNTGRRARAAIASAPDRPAGVLQVTNCDDAGPGSLRQALDDAIDGDAVDLRALAPCTISLDSDIFIRADNVRVLGGGAASHVIDGTHANGMLSHIGAGTLRLQGLTIANGKYTNDHDANGGCVYSTGNVMLIDSVVAGCSTYAQGDAFAMGGAVFALGSVSLERSVVRNGIAFAAGSGQAFGGGIYAGRGLAAFESAISGNQASAATPGLTSYGGGAWSVLGNNTITNSTVSGNQAAQAAGLALYGYDYQTRIVQSTVSGNRSTMGASGLHVGSAGITIRNSTITANVHEPADNSIAGAGLEIPAGFAARLDSNILAGNIVANAKYQPYDFDHGGVPVIGSSNLATSSAVALPGDSLIVADARLGPLADNGGPTLTHAPFVDSLAIDRGSNLDNLFLDQRSSIREFRRPDIGSVEFNDTLFADGFEHWLSF